MGVMKSEFVCYERPFLFAWKVNMYGANKRTLGPLRQTSIHCSMEVENFEPAEIDGRSEPTKALGCFLPVSRQTWMWGICGCDSRELSVLCEKHGYRCLRGLLHSGGA